ncbi:MAG: pimeloyl-CoA dehydrogenase large subunit [Alphaproteobacteria bacterium]|jgi:alkylation response protein AidB-like acyl-CoA dehydrogenase|nr:pimeloyl-CoA dehydrogenase large subunit [Alphaproteobacteria bacterium]
MDMTFTPAEQAFRREVQAFVAENLPAPIARKVADGVEMTRDDMSTWMQILAKQGWLATNWEQKDGGPGWSTAQKHIFEEECAAAGAPDIIPFGTRMVGPVLLAFGTPEQKAKYLPGIVSGEMLWCQGYSEPGAGSDLAQLQLSAKLDGDEYVVNGTKIWTTQAHMADMIFVLARTDNSGRKQDGVTCLLIDMKAPGVTVRPIITIDGRHRFNQEFFDDVRVPVADRVGEAGDGWRIAKYLLGHERSNAAGVAGAVRMLKKLRAIAKAERAEGETLMQDQDFRRTLADVETRLEVLRMTAMRNLARASADKPVGAEASVVKLGMAEIRKDISELSMQAGAYYANPFDPKAIREGWGNQQPIGADYIFKLAPDYFEMRARSIAGGSNEIQKNIIAKRTLGL